ncbi:hypothetical protein CspHIS471_0202370 [Cutaneotrichosporon sp. HIS471]|nr:hypothetical protein CspHIS471_0202370 [Cutaneotrichosporon sp. HIS471]
MSPSLDYVFYPHIIDAIVRFAPHEELLELRLTSKKIKLVADTILNRHISLYSHPRIEGRRAWGTNIRRDSWDDEEHHPPHNHPSKARILDLSEIHMIHNGLPFAYDGFSGVNLIRALPASLDHLESYLDGIPDYPNEQIHFNLPNGTAVRFIEYHRSYYLFPVITGKVKTLVFAILYHPESWDEWIPSFSSPNFEIDCDDIYIILIPEGQPNMEERDEQLSFGPTFLSDIVYKFGMRFDKLWAENRRITFVGGESWDHRWIDRSIIKDYEGGYQDYRWAVRGYPLEDLTQEDFIQEQDNPGASITERFRWWLFEIASLCLGADYMPAFEKSVSFMTLAAFNAKIDNDELVALTTSLRVG